MKKSELKTIIKECVNEVVKKQNVARILREDFNKDVVALNEQRILCEGLVKKGVLTEQQVDEAFFDTIKKFGKNAISGIADAWKNAKEEGNKEEMDRLEKKLAALKAKNTDKEKTSDPEKNKESKQKIVSKAGETILGAVQQQDPKTAAALQNAGPEKIAAALKNPKVKNKADEMAAEIAKEKPEDPKQGFLGKMTSWLKKNPVKGVAAIALLGVVATAAAVGAGGVLPLVGTMLSSGAQGALYGGVGGGLVKGAQALGQGKGFGAAAKELGKGALRGAGTGFIGGAALGFLGSAFQGFSKGFQQLMSSGNGTVNATELEKAKQSLETKSQQVSQSQDIPERRKSLLSKQMSDMEDTLIARGNALKQLGISQGRVYQLDDGYFQVVGKDGIPHVFDKIGAEVTDPNLISKLNAQRDSFMNAYNSTNAGMNNTPVSPSNSAFKPRVTPDRVISRSASDF